MNEEISSLGFGLVHISLLTAAWGLDWCISHCSQRPGVWIGLLTAAWGLDRSISHCSQRPGAWIGPYLTAHSGLGFG